MKITIKNHYWLCFLLLNIFYICKANLKTTFLTYANKKYEMFVLPYIVSVLYHNNDSRVEICLNDAKLFYKKNEEALNLLNRYFGNNRFLIRNATGSLDIMPNTIRFLQKPFFKTKYIYIGDIDILVLEENITKIHLNHMKRTQLSYSNIIRPREKKLTGLHFQLFDSYYPLPDLSSFNLKKENDEHVLYKIILAKNIGLPSLNDDFRPIHGFHFSLNRSFQPVGSRKCFIDLSNSNYMNAYYKMRKSKIWKDLFPLFHPKYRLYISIVNVVLSKIYPKQFLFDDEIEKLFNYFKIISCKLS